MKVGTVRGRLLAIGGKEDRQDKCAILKEFVRLAGGKKARIVVMTIATDKPLAVGKDYIKVFKELGAAAVKIVDVELREDTHARDRLDPIEKATGIFFSGGDQLDVTSLLGGTEMDRVLHARYEDGVILAGTSAGAAMMSHAMISSGEGENNPRLSDVKIAPGAEFLLGAIIDTHFSQRGRHGRLLSAVAQYPHDLGIGIDENTAILVSDSHFDVIGEGAVTIIDVGQADYSNVPDIKDGESLALYSVRLHVLPAGHGFDMDERQPAAGGKARVQINERKQRSRKVKMSKGTAHRKTRTKS